MVEARLRSARLAAALTLAVLGMLAAAAGTASANVSHALSGTLGSASSTIPDPYPITGPTDVAVDQGTHDLYVTDPSHHRVEKFDSQGNFLLMFGKGVDKNTGGNVCPEQLGDQCQTGTSASTSGAFQTPYYLAIDNYPGGEGDVYVGDTGDNLVSKLNSSGHIITGWGVSGQKDGSDASDLPVFGPLFGVAVGGPHASLYVGGTHYSDNVWQFSRSGEYEGPYQGTSGIPWLKVNPQGDTFFTGVEGFFGPPVVTEGVPRQSSPHEYQYFQVGTVTPVSGFALDPSTTELYQGTGTVIDHYAATCNAVENGPCEPADEFGNGDLSEPKGMDVDATSHTVYVANQGADAVSIFGDVRPIVTTGAQSSAEETTVTLTGHVDPAGRGDVNECYFEYGFDKNYGHRIPCSPDPSANPPASYFSGPTDVTATVTGLSPGTPDHYRLVATNTAGGIAEGVDRVFRTTAPPAIDGLSAEHLTATSADLLAQVNPNGLDTNYRFEYGPTTEYGQVAPVPDGTIAASIEDHSFQEHLANLTPHVVYHYRLVAENADGSTTSEDHTFTFYPPSCPNENVRQQTQANFQPDCRAYELVSPADANGTQLFPYGPNTGYATSPSRFAYAGLFSTIEEGGGRPIDGSGDLYVATRTDTGWVSRYVGWNSEEAAVDGGPPMGPPNTTPGAVRGPGSLNSMGGLALHGLDGVFTDPQMSRFLSFNDGNPDINSIFGSDYQNETIRGSNAPYVIAADGTRLERWPTNLESVPEGIYPEGSNIIERGEYVHTSPGGIHALDCPLGAFNHADDFCAGDVTASGELNHFVFATERNIFAQGGQLSAPGSVYDNNTASGSVVVASKTPAGGNIPSEPTDKAGDPLQIPFVSKDGSHILMAAGATGPCGYATCPMPPCGAEYSATKRCPLQVSHLYMRVDGAITYDVSQGHAVDYLGATSDGSKVFFISAEELTAEDQDSSTDIYMWSEATNSLTLVSKGDNEGNAGEPGNSDDCTGGLTTDHGTLTTKCGVATYTNLYYCDGESTFGGNCLSDSMIASEAGDVYFFSQEQLDGSAGIPGQQNMYDYRNGRVQYVTTLTGTPTCFETFDGNTCARVVRMNVSPSDNYVAFITKSPLTQYDNAGHEEMYRYNTAKKDIVCVSCLPSGEPPTSDVFSSQDGLFMTNDGRTFFTSEDALVHSDTNHALDVYEYVDGRPQLITPGTGETRTVRQGFGTAVTPGLVGVSANGTDVYFSTFDTLVPQDHNGLFLKFYDARAGGGFPAPAPPPPCAAADECHGEGSAPPAPLSNGTGVQLGAGGNFNEKAHKRRRHAKHSSGRHHRRKNGRTHSRNRRAGK